jgi:S1-C subfamily serine protease
VNTLRVNVLNNCRSAIIRLAGIALLLGTATGLVAQNSVTQTARDVNRKLVKLFGAGGFKGLPSYGTGVLISPKGFILTVNNHILTTSDLRVHLYDGRSYHAKVVAREPDLDLAVLKIEEEVDFLPCYDIPEAAAKPLAETGDFILAHSNCFQVATRDEPMSVQRGVVATYAELRGRRGVFDAPFAGEVYFIDAIANNPGSAGGIITNRKGDLLGIIGRELKNALTDTWINYAVPVRAKAEYFDDDKKAQTIDVVKFVDLAMSGQFKAREKSKRDEQRGFTGLLLVPNAVSATPPYVEEVLPGSPAAQAGLRPDDLIVYVEGELVPTIRDFRDVMKYIAPGTEIKIDVQRGLRMHNLKLKIAEPPKVKAGV